jgi:anti-sigma factor RsiW
MSEPLDVAEVEELIGAYALDAVDADERAAVEAHLPGCPRCRAELADHLEVASFLAHTGAPAPDGLWGRIASSLEEPPPALRLGVVDASGRAARPRRSHLLTVLAVAAAIVVAVMVVQLVRQGRQIDDLHGQVSAQGVSKQAMAALADPASRRFALSSPHGGAATATAVITPSGTGYLLADQLPKLPADRTYQLWGIMPGHVISLGLLGRSPGVTAFSGEGRLTGLAVTDEVAGGVSASTNPPVLLTR